MDEEELQPETTGSGENKPTVIVNSDGYSEIIRINTRKEIITVFVRRGKLEKVEQITTTVYKKE